MNKNKKYLLLIGIFLILLGSMISYHKPKVVAQTSVTEYFNNQKEKILEIIESIKIPKARDLKQFEGKKLIAFTFDDGPSNQSTNKLLDNLDKYNARVTFFVLGSRVSKYQDSLKRAYLMGNQIGSHTYSHSNLYRLKIEEVKEEMTKTNLAIKNITGEDVTLLRPPYGNIDTDMKKITDLYTILWDIDPKDWKYKDKEKIADNIVSNAHDGGIVLLHDIYLTSIDGALLAMERLEKEGYAFVTIEEMITLKGVAMDKEKTYFNFK